MSVNKTICRLYVDGKQSIPQIAAKTGLPASTVRGRLVKAGVTLRNRTEGIRAREGLGLHLVGKKRTFTAAWKKNISKSRQRWADENAKGTSVNGGGYVQFTRGENKNRSEHVVVMESRLGRHLLPDEAVHHIDRDRTNNSSDNLALVTRAGHARLHRFEDSLAGIERKRANGRFS